jgi:uncharacterized protein (DUF2235 family)
VSKVIVFCADGTWDGPGQPDGSGSIADGAAPSNVFKLFANLSGVDTPESIALADEQERVLKDAGGTATQWSKYLHGVGDSDNLLVKLLGGTVGAGLIARIVRGYTFISRTYAAGDSIFIVGFSRGAYTARALAGMIASQGLLDQTQLPPSDKGAAYRLGTAVWNRWRATVLQTKPGLLDKLYGLVQDLPGFMSQTVTADQLVKVPIEMVAVWDTVGSLGIPVFTVQGSTLDVFQFADTVLSAAIARGVHAVAVDERRGDFTPTLWTPDPRVTQMLFPGCHGDVGGGYPMSNGECGLSDCTLQWMTKALADRGVVFLQAPSYPPAPDDRGPAHQPWQKLPWNLLPQTSRVFPVGLTLSKEVVARAAAAAVVPNPGLPPCAYAPANLASYMGGATVA